MTWRRHMYVIPSPHGDAVTSDGYLSLSYRWHVQRVTRRPGRWRAVWVPLRVVVPGLDGRRYDVQAALDALDVAMGPVTPCEAVMAYPEAVARLVRAIDGLDDELRNAVVDPDVLATMRASLDT